MFFTDIHGHHKKPRCLLGFHEWHPSARHAQGIRRYCLGCGAISRRA